MGVDDADHRVAERGARHERRQCQVRARLHVVALLAGARQVGGDELDRLDGERVGHRVLLNGGVGLHSVRQGVHAGGGGELGRQRGGERRIEYGGMRHQLVGRERELRVLVRVGDHGDQRHLAAGARGGGHGDERRHVAREDLGALQRGEVDAFAGQRGRSTLGGVDDRAAADGDEPVAAALLVEVRHLVHDVHRGVGRHLVEHVVGDAGGIEHAGELGGDAQLHQAGVGHHQRMAHALGLQFDGQLVQRVAPADDLGGAVEFETRGHGVFFLAGRYAARRCALGTLR